MTPRRSSALRASVAMTACAVVMLMTGVTGATASGVAAAQDARPQRAPLYVNPTVVYRFSPSPVAPGGSLAGGVRVTVTLTAQDAAGQGDARATVYVSFTAAAGGGSAAVGGAALTSAPTSFTTDASGAVQIVYRAPAKLPTSGEDAITAQDKTSSPTDVNTDYYAFNPATPTVSVGDVTVVEGDQHPAIPATFTVTLSSAQPKAVTVQYTTLCGVGDTTCGGDDYPPVNNPVTVTIPALQTSTSIVVRQYSYVGANGRETYNEGWFVKLENPGGAVLGRSIGNGLLLPDVENGHLRVADLYVGNASVLPTLSSAGVPLYITVTLGAVEAGPVSFHYATADGSAQSGKDYTAISGTATIAAGTTSLTLQVLALPGPPPSSDEAFTLTISKVTGGPVIGRATGTDIILSA